MSYVYESKMSLELKTSLSAHCESECEGPIDGITWRITAFRSEPQTARYSTSASLRLEVLASKEMAAKNLSYAVQIRIGDFTQNIKNIAPNKDKHADAFQSASGKESTFTQVVCQKTPTLINATLTIRSPHDQIPVPSIFKDISDPDLVDFTIQIGDKTWKAHKYIMSARSLVFRRMFANKECEESKKNLMVIADVSEDIFELFFHFLYTDRIPTLSLSQASDVLIAADKYDVEALKKKCDDMIVKMLKEGDPVHDVFQFAHTYNCSLELKQKAFDLLLLTIRAGKTLLGELVKTPEMVKMLVDKTLE